jgi:hypothetical protein
VRRNAASDGGKCLPLERRVLVAQPVSLGNCPSQPRRMTRVTGSIELVGQAKALSSILLITELVIRLAAGDDAEPPPWGVRLLRRLADQVLQSQTLFLPGQRLENRTPLADDPASLATCLLFTGDVDLHRVDRPTGRFEFVRVVPVSPAELREAPADLDRGSRRDAARGIAGSGRAAGSLTVSAEPQPTTTPASADARP